ncbi:PH domain-containing protein [bacterium]|nr:PH domain-containing protein [bacterium]
MSENEETLWKGKPSQFINFNNFLLLGIVVLLIIILSIYLWGWLLYLIVFPCGYALQKWLILRSYEYELTSERLRVTTGIFTKSFEEIELYRIRDYSIVQPFFLRLFSLGNVILKTSDKTMPDLTISAIKDFMEVKDKIRARVEILRREKDIKEIDYT